jgi:hypothetical protein
MELRERSTAGVYNNSLLAPNTVGPVQKAATSACSIPLIGIQKRHQSAAPNASATPGRKSLRGVDKDEKVPAGAKI